jgi:hypothetical protein
VLQTDMWAVAFLNGRRMVSIPLAKTGDATAGRFCRNTPWSPVTRNRRAPCSI